MSRGVRITPQRKARWVLWCEQLVWYVFERSIFSLNSWYQGENICCFSYPRVIEILSHLSFTWLSYNLPKIRYPCKQCLRHTHLQIHICTFLHTHTHAHTQKHTHLYTFIYSMHTGTTGDNLEELISIMYDMPPSKTWDIHFKNYCTKISIPGRMESVARNPWESRKSR